MAAELVLVPVVIIGSAGWGSTLVVPGGAGLARYAVPSGGFSGVGQLEVSDDGKGAPGRGCTATCSPPAGTCSPPHTVPSPAEAPQVRVTGHGSPPPRRRLYCCWGWTRSSCCSWPGTGALMDIDDPRQEAERPALADARDHAADDENLASWRPASRRLDEDGR